MNLRSLILLVAVLGIAGCADTGAPGPVTPSKAQPTKFKEIEAKVRAQSGGARLTYLRSRCKVGRLGDVLVEEMPEAVVLEGVGVVFGLNGRGTKNVPKGMEMRKVLLKSLVKEYKAPEMASQVLDSTDSAPVMVVAELPPFSAKGSKLDVRVQAFDPNVNLEGGILGEAALERLVNMPPGVKVDPMFVRSGRRVSRGVQAYARGLVSLIPPRRKAAARAKTKAHLGYLAASAVVIESHGMVLRLRQPDVYQALLTEEVISARVNLQVRAVSESAVQMGLPSAYADEWQRFLRVVFELDSASDPSAAVRRAEAHITGLGAGDPRVRGRAEYALEAIGNAAVPVMLRSLPASAGVKRQALLRVLAHLEVPDVLDELVAQAMAGNELERVEAARLLARLKGTRSENALIGLLSDESGVVRSEAIRSLDKLMPKRRVPFTRYYSREKTFVMNKSTLPGMKQVIVRSGPGIRRIDVFGDSVTVSDGFKGSAGPAAVSVVAGHTQVVITQRPDLPEMNIASADIRDIIARLDLAGVTINDIIALLEQMDASRSLNARVVWLD